MSTQIKVHDLPKTFTGRAEVKQFEFSQVKSTKYGFIYKVNETHFEVFKYKLTPICIDFAKRIYLEDEFKIHYPKKNAFGVWAWTAGSIERAEEILAEITKKAKNDAAKITN
jgi:hypothetical protein